MNTSDPDGVNLRTEPIAITAGPHRVSAAFIRRFEGPAQDLIAPLDWSLASTSIADAYGFTTLPHLRDLAITGPFAVTGVSRDAEPPEDLHVPVRTAAAPQQDGVRARRSSSRLALAGVQAPGRRARSQRVDVALQARARPRAGSRRASGWRSKASWPARGSCSASRSAPAARAPARPTRWAIWTSPRGCRSSSGPRGPDEELCAWRRRAGCRRRPALERQARRMLADRRSDVLASRFAAQWLRLQDLDKINPDVRVYPGLRRAAQDVDAARDRAVLPPHRPRGPAGAATSSPPTTRSSTSGSRGTTAFPNVIGRRVPQGARIRTAGAAACSDTAAS